MTRKTIFPALLLAMFMGDMGSLVHAAQPIILSVDSLFRLIDDRSRTIRLKALCVDEAVSGESVARSSLLPHIDATLSVGYLGDGYLTDRDFGNGMMVHNPHSKNDFALEAMQVIYSGGELSGNIHMAKLNADMARLDLEESHQQVKFLLLGWLIDLQCIHNRIRVLDENIGLARSVLDNVRARYDEGVALKSDITRYELQLEALKLQREKAGETMRTTNYRLANALGFPTGDTEFIPAMPLMDGTKEIEPENSWQEQAQSSSIMLQKAGLGISMSETSRKIATAALRPKLSLFAYGQFNSPIVTEVPIINKNIMFWGFGASLSFNISSLYTANHRIRQARIAEMESREAYNLGVENVENNVQEAYEGYRTAVTELRTQEKSLELARQNYDIVNDRFENGMALVTDMVDAANVRLSSETGVENARTTLLFRYYKLKYATNTL